MDDWVSSYAILRGKAASSESSNEVLYPSTSTHQKHI